MAHTDSGMIPVVVAGIVVVVVAAASAAAVVVAVVVVDAAAGTDMVVVLVVDIEVLPVAAGDIALQAVEWEAQMLGGHTVVAVKGSAEHTSEPAALVESVLAADSVVFARRHTGPEAGCTLAYVVVNDDQDMDSLEPADFAHRNHLDNRLAD